MSEELRLDSAVSASPSEAGSWRKKGGQVARATWALEGQFPLIHVRPPAASILGQTFEP